MAVVFVDEGAVYKHSKLLKKRVETRSIYYKMTNKCQRTPLECNPSKLDRRNVIRMPAILLLCKPCGAWLLSRVLTSFKKLTKWTLHAVWEPVQKTSYYEIRSQMSQGYVIISHCCSLTAQSLYGEVFRFLGSRFSKYKVQWLNKRPL